MPNQNPKQIARDEIDKMLSASGWIVQPKDKMRLNAGLGITVTECQTDIDPGQ